MLDFQSRPRGSLDRNHLSSSCLRWVAEAGRGRVFLLLCPEGTNPLPLNGQASGGKSILVGFQQLCQELTQADFLTSGWNKVSEIPAHEWLQPHMDAAAKDSMSCLGNVVVPQQACLAVRLLCDVLNF